jgi:hypothetical protein
LGNVLLVLRCPGEQNEVPIFAEWEKAVFGFELFSYRKPDAAVSSVGLKEAAQGRPSGIECSATAGLAGPAPVRFRRKGCPTPAAVENES